MRSFPVNHNTQIILKCLPKGKGVIPIPEMGHKGVALLDLEKYREANLEFDMVIKIDPNNSNAHFKKGNIFSILGDKTKARELYDKAIELDPKNADAYHNKGTILAFLGSYHEAINLYDKAIVLDPKCANAYYNKGQALLNLKRYEEALVEYDKAQKLDPKITLESIIKACEEGNLVDVEQAELTKWFDAVMHHYSTQTSEQLGHEEMLGKVEIESQVA